MYAADVRTRGPDDTVQMRGGDGCIWEFEINRLRRSTKLLKIGAGTTEVRRLIIVGELVR
jgi:isovaleryl-CoA dehydrogenase